MKAVIQAGGQGARLRPYTLVLPKPLMPVGKMPVIEMLLKWLRRNGVEEIYITLGYLGHLIKALCADGSQWGMHIRYAEEPEPLGTIGPLRLLRDELDETFLVLNGDLITDMDLRAFVAFHRKQEGLLTVGTFSKTMKIDLGVIDSKTNRIVGFEEKPTKTYLVSMGIYCMEPAIIEHVPVGVPFGFDNLVHHMLAKNLPVYTYRHDGYWMDIGREEDFLRAQEFVDE
jgi:NDP-mannose synthase